LSAIHLVLTVEIITTRKVDKDNNVSDLVQLSIGLLVIIQYMIIM